MKYARWATIEEIKNRLVAVNTNTEIKKSGVPIMYDGDDLYIDESLNHTLVIGGMESSKKETILLPQIKLAMKAGESIIINDFKGQIYNNVGQKARENGYNVIVIDYSMQEKYNNFNPLSLPYELYKNGHRDEALEILDNIAKTIFYSKNNNVDPFWDNMASNYFIGLSLCLFENVLNFSIDINSIYKLARENDKLLDYINNLDKLSKIYINLSGILLAPKDTRDSIISIFTQKLGLFVSKENLSELLSNTDFDIKSIQNEKTALFINSNGKDYQGALISMLIYECCYAVCLDNNTRRLNILIDEFQSIAKIPEFSNILVSSRLNNIRFTICIRSLLELTNIYGKENTIMMAFSNIIYLLTNDIETLAEISNLCGKINNTDPLVTIEELKLLDNYEAIVIMSRIHPIKTKLLSDNKTNLI